MRGNCAAGFASDHGTNHIADRQRGRAFRFRFALGRQRVCGFAGLADAHGKSFRIHNRVAIAEFASVVDFDGKTGETFNHEFGGQPSVPAGAAGDDAHLLKFAKLVFRDGHLIEEDFSGVLRNAAEQGVAHSARLLKNLFLHEMLVAALFRHDGIPGHVVRGAFDRAAVVVHHMHTFGG